MSAEVQQILEEMAADGIVYLDPNGRWHIREDVTVVQNEDGSVTAHRKASS